MVTGNIAATSLKMLWKNLYLVKCYDKLNMNVLTLSLWENFWWGLIYFDQFNYLRNIINDVSMAKGCCSSSCLMTLCHSDCLFCHTSDRILTLT